MTQLSISFDTKLVRQGLQDLSAEIPKIGRSGIYKMEQTVVRRMKEYWTIGVPSPLPSYQRTGRLAGGYFITPITNGYKITNNVPYTQYVVGNEYGLEQASVHVGRHKLFRDVNKEEVDNLLIEINKEIVAAARRFGFQSTEAFGL